MEVYTPAFNKIKELIQKSLIEFIAESIVVNSIDINRFILELKKQNIKKNKDYNLIEFAFSYPHSYQVQDLLVDLIRRCIIKQTREGYELTSYGYRLISNNL